jgi:6-pyruvoyltetrahydropterin/6-carboxytetrahydropterin synthase
MTRTSIRVGGIELSAAHFISEGERCERLHGHNYQLAVHVVGEVDARGMVADFRLVKDVVRQLCEGWDHRVLLPARSPRIKVASKGDQTKVVTPNGTYSFPAQDVKVLDIIETTAEELARLLCQLLADALKPRFSRIRQVAVSVAENPRQWATVTLDL